MTYRTMLACTITLLGAAGCAQPPQIDNLSATTASFGEEIVVTGAHFDDQNDIGFGDSGFLNLIPSDDGETLSFTIEGSVGVCAMTQLDDDVFCPSVAKILEPGSYELFVATSAGDSNAITLIIE